MNDLKEFSWWLIVRSVVRQSWVSGALTALSLTVAIGDRSDSVALGFLVFSAFLFGASIMVGIYQPFVDAMCAGFKELKRMAEELE